MADNRKGFRPRRLAFGGRSFPCACGLASALAICAAAIGPAGAEDAGLKNGAASLSAGKYDAAVRQLSSTINSDTAAPADAARALYLRGLAYRKMGDSAHAIADLGAAIWLGLPEPDKVKAFVNRGLAYKSAGLSREGDAEFASARKIGGSAVDTLIAEGGGVGEGAAAVAAFSTEVHPAAGGGEQLPVRNEAAAPPTRTADASPTAWSTSVADGQQSSSASSGNRLTRWFGSVTGSSSSAPTPPPEPAPVQQAAPPPKPAAPPPSAAAASSSWSTTTETQQAAATPSGGESGSRWSRLFNRSAEAEPPAQPAPSTSGGSFPLQLATSRSEAEAKALWKKVSQNQAVGGAQPQIEKVDIGNFGTFWSLRIGPFTDKAESLKVCNALKRSGIDCSPVTP
jgi:SPOR domain